MENGESVGANAPPQVSFKTIKNTIADFKAKGVLPPKIDKRLWPNYSNTVATQTVAALKFLGLIDEAGVPTIMLETMASPDIDEASWRTVLDTVVRSAYTPVMDIELDKVHGSHLRDKFKAAFGLEGDPQRKAIAFFLFAARDAGMKLSPYLKLRERGPNKSPRKKREKPETSAVNDRVKEQLDVDKKVPPASGVGTIRKIHEHQAVLVEIINTYPDMTNEMRTSILSVVGFISTKGVMP